MSKDIFCCHNWLLLISSEKSPGTLPIILQSAGQLLQQRRIWPKMSRGPRLRNPGAEAFWESHLRRTYMQAYFEQTSLWVRANLMTWGRTLCEHPFSQVWPSKVTVTLCCIPCLYCLALVPKHFGSGDRYRGRQFFHGRRGGGREDGSGSNAIDGERWGAADEASLACLLLTSCCAARFPTGHGPVPVHDPGVADPRYMVYIHAETLMELKNYVSCPLFLQRSAHKEGYPVLHPPK